MAFADALRQLNAMKAEGVVEDYAIAGGMAIVFWTEPTPTFDMDVLVALPEPQGPLVSLDRIYRWAATRGYPTQDEHILVEGLPTQFLPAPHPLAAEAIAGARDVSYEDVSVRVAFDPPPDVLARLRQGKADLHKRHASLPLPEKIRLVIELQRMVLPLLARQRPLRSWERPWEIEP